MRTLSDATLSAVDRSFADFEAMRPPAGVAGFHLAMVAGMAALGEELRRQAALPDPTSHEAIEALNAQFSIVFARAAAQFDAESLNLDADTFAALGGVTRCGAVTNP